LQALSLLNGALTRMALDPLATEIVMQQGAAIDTMSQLVSALLDISKLESGAVAPQMADFEMAAMLQDLRREFASLASTKGLQLRVESTTAFVRSDPALLAQILRNLISNAIKYTHQGKVTVRCMREADEVSIEVADTGVGIAPEQLPHIYQEFFRIRSGPSQAGEGYGLGLSIVRRLIDLLDLGLEVASELGTGTLFRLRLHASAAGLQTPGVRTSSAMKRSEPAARRRLLLVEDDAAVRHATRMLLAAEGFTVTCAASYAEALQRTRESSGFDLLVSDYHLGTGETGADVIAALRGQLGQELPAILLTGDTSPAVKGIQLDSKLRLASKPVQAERLLVMVSELLGGSAG
jgi:CheY-like chemotaxis protein/two-component sensor histidine kinase